MAVSCESTRAAVDKNDSFYVNICFALKSYVACESLVLLHESLVVLVDLQDFADAIGSHLSLQMFFWVINMSNEKS